MDIVVTAPEGATAVILMDEDTGEFALSEQPEGNDLIGAVRLANDQAGGNPVWGQGLETLVQWAESSGNALTYDLPDVSIPDDAVA